VTSLAVSSQELAQQGINVFGIGSTYALLAIGLAMVFSILGLINFAHGELVTVSAYTIYLGHVLEVPFVLSLVAAVAAAALVAVLMERIAFRPLRGAGFVTLLLSSFAVSIVIQSLFIALVSPRQKGVPFPGFFSDTLAIGSLTIGWLEIMSAVVCFGALILLTLMLRRTVSGLGMVAASQDFAVTRLMGIRANRVIALAFAISGLLAGLAAIFILARRGTVEPTMGFTPVLKGFIAIVIGGLGSLSGAVFGGFVLAFVEVTLATFLPDDLAPFRDAFALTIVIAILYFRPNGLLGRREAYV
jgi:branched-chain amino acid transport system permease protein